MKNGNLRRKIGGLFLVFICLTAILIAVLYWVNTTHQQDLLALQLVYDQHDLILDMIFEVEQLEYHEAGRPSQFAALKEGAGAFESTLSTLIAGGPAFLGPDNPVDLPPPQNPEIKAQLQQFQHTWQDYRGYLNILLAMDARATDFVPTILKMEAMAGQLSQESHALTSLYEAGVEESLVHLAWIQGFLPAAAIGFAVLSLLVIQKSILQPLNILTKIAERITRGDLNAPIEVSGPREIEAMAHSLATLRTQLKISQAQLISQAEKLDVRIAQRAHELTAVFEISQDIVDDLELGQLLTSVTDRAIILTQAEVASLCLSSRNGRYLHLVARSGETELAQSVAGADEPISTITDCSNCRFLAAQSQSGQTFFAPLQAGEQTVGSLCVARPRPKPFSGDETRALTLLANSAAIAIANACLVESGRRHAEQIAAVAEREQLAAELHDHLAQILSLVNLKAGQLEFKLAAGCNGEVDAALDNLQASLKEAYTEVRTALVGLRKPTEIVATMPTLEARQELAGKIEACLVDFRQISKLPVELTIVDPAALALPAALHKQVLYVIREALINVQRHAQAQRIWVRVNCSAEGSQAQFTIADDGRGFDPTCVDEENHMGITIMRMRVERNGGRLVIDSTPGAGTKVVASFPLDPENIRRN